MAGHPLREPDRLNHRLRFQPHDQFRDWPMTCHDLSCMCQRESLIDRPKKLKGTASCTAIATCIVLAPTLFIISATAVSLFSTLYTTVQCSILKNNQYNKESTFEPRQGADQICRFYNADQRPPFRPVSEGMCLGFYLDW